MAHNYKSIAVLPFTNLSKDSSDEYFSDGITEEIINSLSRHKALKVIARTSSFAFKNTNDDIRTIANTLNVNTIVEGSIRRHKDKVRISAHLIDATNGLQLWSQNYTRQYNDIFELQDEISLLIAEQVRQHFGHFEILQPASTSNAPEVSAYDHYLRGLHLLKRKDYTDIQNALKAFEAAIKLDPDFAEAYACIGETILHIVGFNMVDPITAREQALKSAERAIEIHPSNARAHKVLAYIYLFYDWKWEAASNAYQKAIALGLPEQNEFISYYYIFINNEKEKAIEVAKALLLTDPLHVMSHWQLGICYYFNKQFKEALASFEHTLQLDPEFSEAYRWKGLMLAYLGQTEEGEVFVERALQMTGGEGLAFIDLMAIKILQNKHTEVVATIQKTDFTDPMDAAMLYALMNKHEEALQWLHKGWEDRSIMMATIKNFWVWDNLRANQQFQELCNRLNFPETGIVLDVDRTTEVQLLTNEEMALISKKLDKLIDGEAPYLDPEISLRSLAEQLKLNPNRLSYVLNTNYHQNFNEFINTFRIARFKELALKPENSHITVLGLAYDSGFNSKTVFNTFFKKSEGVTPSQWVRLHGK
jgi:TolB-like protein/AraC-like DNA-binding protein/Tfp pilus assembly protein PilF